MSAASDERNVELLLIEGDVEDLEHHLDDPKWDWLDFDYDAFGDEIERLLVESAAGVDA
jgi:hypothetical protein